MLSRSLRLGLALIAILLILAPVQAQGIPAGEPDTEAFLDANFHLQDSYSRVLCVAGDGSCPAEIETAVPCLTAACVHPAQTYPIAATFDTIQAAADAAQPGDLVIIRPGRYAGIDYEETGGADGAYIHFLGWGEPGSVIVDRPARPDVGYLRHHFYLIAVHHVIVQNLAFEGADNGAGLFVSGYFSGTGQFAHHVIVTDVYSHDNGEWGLHTTASSFLLIQDSIFTGSAEEHGAYLSGSGDDIVVRRNVFQGNNAAGLQINADPQTATSEVFYWLADQTGDTCGWTEDDVEFTGAATWDDLKACYDGQGLPDLGQYFEDGISARLIVEQNVITGNGAAGGAGINLAAVHNSTVRNNLIYGNDAAAIACWDNAYAEEKGLASSDFGCQGVTIAHNTLVDESGGRGALILNQDARDMAVFSNVIVRDRADAYEVTSRSGEGLRSGANLITAQVIEDSPGAVFIDTDPASGSIVGISVADALAQFVAPGFAPWVIEDGPWPTLNPARPDFHPRADSAPVGLADAAHVPTLDLSGAPRTTWTIGALEPSTEAAPPAVITPAPAAEAAPGGGVTYTLPEGHVYRIAAQAGAQPEDVSAALDAIAPGEDEWLATSPDGTWLLTSTDRFDPACAGWPCLTLLSADLAAAESVATAGAPIHAEGMAAIGQDATSRELLVVYGASGGPHDRDLWQTRRAPTGGWSAPQLLTGDSPYTWHQQPALAADGSRVIFDCGDEPYNGAGTALCEVGTDGSGWRIVLTPDDTPPGLTPGGALHHPAYAPDGSLVFEGDWDGERIWRLPAEGGAPVRVGDYGNDNSPCVLPDGRIVSLWLNREGNPSGGHEIKLMPPDGSAYVMLLADLDVLDAGLSCGG